MGNEYIVPGEQIVNVISAMPGGNAERILHQISHPAKDHNPMNRRDFGRWKAAAQGGSVYSEGTVYFAGDGSTRGVVLKVGVEEGLVLKDVRGDRLSLRPAHNLPSFTLQIGTTVKPDRIPHLANMIVGTWIIHGTGWYNRSGACLEWPYGEEPKRTLVPHFKTVDGAADGLTLQELIDLGGVRSAHPGQWDVPYTLVPAYCGLPILLHEFQEYGNAPDFNVCVFGDMQISSDSCTWGPYCRWSSRDLGPRAKPLFQKIADHSASPFAFHVHATQYMLPSICTLASAYILDKLGEQMLGRVFDLVVEKTPERVYRLIDEEGITHRLLEVHGDKLVFEGNRGQKREFPRKEAAGNLLGTFKDMQRVEHDMAFDLPRIARVVLDSHFYVVAFGIITAQNGVSRHLSGSEMYRYMLVGDQAGMHRIRNEQLFSALKQLFGIEYLQFRVYPSENIAAPDGLTQYGDLAELNKDVLLQAVLK